jgi:hypothetical protein
MLRNWGLKRWASRPLCSPPSFSTWHSGFLKFLAPHGRFFTFFDLQILQIHEIASTAKSTSLDLPTPSADVPRTMSNSVRPYPSASTLLDIAWSRHPFSMTSADVPEPVFDFPRFHPTFVLFLGLPICPISLISFSTITGPPWTVPLHSSVFFDIPQLHSAFRSQDFRDFLDAHHSVGGFFEKAGHLTEKVLFDGILWHGCERWR